MTERITAQMVANSTINTIDNDLNQLDATQEELSTGYQINEPSDDPVGAAITLSLQGQISAYDTYQQNISQGVAVVETEGTSLQQILSVLQSAQEVTTEAANGTSSATDLDDSAQQILQYIAQIKQTANTQYDGSYVFGGSDVDNAPYDETVTASDPAGEDAYSGNLDTVNYAIGPGTQLPVSADLFSVLGNGIGPAGAFNNPGATDTPPTTDTATGGLLATLRQIYNDMTGQDGGTQQDLGNQLTNLTTNQAALESLQANVGATQDRLQMADTRITSLTSTDTIELGNVYDTNMPAATAAFSTEQAGYQAALQSTADIIQTSLMNFLDT